MCITEVVSTLIFILYLNKIRALTVCIMSDFYNTMLFELFQHYYNKVLKFVKVYYFNMHFDHYDQKVLVSQIQFQILQNFRKLLHFLFLTENHGV